MTPTQCPFCSAEILFKRNFGTVFKCTTMVTKETQQSDTCLRSQRDQLLERGEQMRKRVQALKIQVVNRPTTNDGAVELMWVNTELERILET